MSAASWKYLRVCGEESRLALMAAGMLEIPPRVRRRAGAWPFNVVGSGNTSACAEKRRLSGRKRRLVRIYLRVCGEERFISAATLIRPEIPPRVRRRVGVAAVDVAVFGNTSACAEKRCVLSRRRRVRRKYLRVCGEESVGLFCCEHLGEIPPRVRRRVLLLSVVVGVVGNTSACAEKSAAAGWGACENGKYLRVCGEEPDPTSKLTRYQEIPPRVRRRDSQEAPEARREGNTSACAEKRGGRGDADKSRRKYLRVCGEEKLPVSLSQISLEIPPRVRRRGCCLLACGISVGNTSACAEKSAGRSA